MALCTFFWGPRFRIGSFDNDVAEEEIEGILEKLNEGSPFEGNCRVVR